MLAWWWVTLFIKLLIVSFSPMTSDENYYWVWAQNLSLSYFDHPPFVAWLFKVGSYLPEFMLKWPALFLGHLALLIWGRFLVLKGFTATQVRSWYLLAVLAPLVGMSAMVLTPDLPLMFFYALSLYSFDRAINEKKLVSYILFGAALGLGFTSKYHIVLVIPCLLIYLFFTKKWCEIQWKYLPWVVFFGLLGSSPVLLWNYQNDWASFRFQLHHGVGQKAWKAIWPWEYLASILFLILPLYWNEFLQALKNRNQKLLVSLSVPILIFFEFTSFRSKVEANWSQLAFFPLLSLLAFYDLTRWKAKAALTVWIVLLSVLLWHWNQNWYVGCPDKLCEPKRYKAVLEVSKKFTPFMASNYQMASYLWFQTKQPAYKLYDMSRTDYFDTFRESRPVVNSFYLAKHLETDLPSWLRSEGYKTESIKMIDEDLILLRVFK